MEQCERPVGGIHPDFRAIRKRSIPLDSRRLTPINLVLKVLNAIRRPRFDGELTARSIGGAGAQRIAVTVIRPAGLPPPCPALIYIHGGAFVFGHSPQHIENVVQYACDAGCCVFFVDYRLAPRHRFPKGFNDCYSTLRWVCDNADALAIDRHKIAVGGDSAGGALAAGVAQKAADDGIRLCGQLLIYPMTDCDCKTRSLLEYADTPPFRRLSARAVWRAYLGTGAGTASPAYASPIHGSLRGVAPAYVEISEFDPLRDEGNAYAQAMAAAGVEVALTEEKGTVHGYDLLVPDSELSKSAVARRVKFLREAFGVRDIDVRCPVVGGQDRA